MSSCSAARAVAPELALGIASGEDRAETLRHLASCPECRSEVESLARAADELLLMAPEHDPPVGFESRAVEDLSRGGAAPRRVRRWGLVAVAACIAALLGAGGVYLATNEDREAGAYYRAQFAEAGGKYLVVSGVRDRGHHELGRVFAYEGDPSWLLVTADRGTGPGTYEVLLETTDGSRVSVGDMEVTAAGGSWGHAIPVDVHRLASIALAPSGGGEPLRASFNHD
ncbi:hypothetical protein BH18ACT15_BH18ACT15_15110 [soil metagenome]